jgi:cytochrome c oxidase subunit 3
MKNFEKIIKNINLNQGWSFIEKYHKYHTFHLVNPSPWPFTTAFGLLYTTFGAVLYFHYYELGSTFFFLGFLITLSSFICWCRDIVREATFEGFHTKNVQKNVRIGFVLFIVSEIMFFFAFFWAYFHSSISPSIEIACAWPPPGITIFNPWSVPFLNTVILLTSGITLTWAHHIILKKDYKNEIAFSYTILLAIFFTFLQLYEYKNATFSINDSVFGSCFYMTTGFHGFHVLVGTIFIYVTFYRYISQHFSKNRHLGFEICAWYWHFVDVVWLFLFICLYWWPSIKDTNEFLNAINISNIIL